MTLTSRERAALGNLCEFVDCDRIRIRREPADRLRAVVLAISGGRAVALCNDVFLPARHASDIGVLAHELTHCGQYQAWGALTYYGRGIVDRVREVLHLTLGVGESPYRYAAEDKPFDAYGMEQQGQIVEDCFNGDAVAWVISPYRPAHRTV